MSNIITLDETIEVDRPLHEVFAYVSEFSRVEEWDPAVARGIKLTAGVPGVGSEYQIDMKAGFSLHYRVVEFEEDSRMLMDVDSRFFTAREEILFEAADAGTRLRYIAKFDFPAPLAAFNRLYPAAMERIGKSAMAGLKGALEDDFPCAAAVETVGNGRPAGVAGSLALHAPGVPGLAQALERHIGLPGRPARRDYRGHVRYR